MTTDNTTHVKKAPVIRFRADTTIRWSMRDGDTLIWFRAPNPTRDASNMPISGSWNLRDGDRVLLTNRVADVPGWFTLHPDDVCNAQCLKAAPRLKAAIEGFTPQATGQNIWRVTEGDRLLWIGDPREGLEGKDGVLAVLDCRASMLVLGEPATRTAIACAAFGTGYNTKTPPLVLSDRVQLAFEAAYNLGSSRTKGLEWRLGDRDPLPTRNEVAQAEAAMNAGEATKPEASKITPQEHESEHRYLVTISDNFHYMDQDYNVDAGEFPNREAAIHFCQKRVRDSLEECYEPGMTPEELITQYKAFGEDPWIVSNDEEAKFSAWKYAEEIAEEVIQAEHTEQPAKEAPMAPQIPTYCIKLDALPTQIEPGEIKYHGTGEQTSPSQAVGIIVGLVLLGIAGMIIWSTVPMW